MKLRLKTLTAVVALLSLTAVPASASLLTFENPPGTLTDDDAIGDAYKSSDGVTFIGGFLEAYGEDGTDGFVNDPAVRDVQEGSQFPAPQNLGNFFVRTEGDIGSRGSNAGDTFLQIIYDEPTTAASGQIWDIDGNNSQGTEQWNVVALAGIELTSDVVVSHLSPLGTTTGSDSLNGLPWEFSLQDSQGFKSILFEFTGTKDRGIGLAFDNFRTDRPQITQVPTPATFGLFGFGLIAVGFAAMRRKKANN